ncbi:hypothetical protein [Alkalihalobacillus sp. R86527]|uniref:hypothetical protein n=1 Tax=Alkalihalobacillus sp. R86527 TaxID=3093863 RepID=UPI00366EAE15
MEGLGIMIVMTIFLWSLTKTIVNVSEKITEKLQKQNDLLEEIKYSINNKDT